MLVIWIHVFVFCFFEAGFIYSCGTCPGTSSCRPGWPQTHRNLPASASCVLGLKACSTTTPAWIQIFVIAPPWYLRMQTFPSRGLMKTQACPPKNARAKQSLRLHVLHPRTKVLYSSQPHSCGLSKKGRLSTEEQHPQQFLANKQPKEAWIMHCHAFVLGMLHFRHKFPQNVCVENKQKQTTPTLSSNTFFLIHVSYHHISN